MKILVEIKKKRICLWKILLDFIQLISIAFREIESIITQDLVRHYQIISILEKQIRIKDKYQRINIYIYMNSYYVTQLNELLIHIEM